MRKLLVALAGLVAGAGAGWIALVRIQGDSLMVYEPQELSSVSASADVRSLHGEITIVTRGKVGGLVHKVFGRIVEGAPGRVLVTRKGSRPPERGWWQSNCLTPGESCVAEVDVELDAPAEGPVTIELDTHEIGRRLVVHRTVRLAIAAPRPVAPAEALTAQP